MDGEPPGQMGHDDAIELVRRGYDHLSDRYRGDDDDPEEYRRWLDRLLRRLPPSSRVLDLGCGNGVPAARRLADAGHLVTGVDLSGRQIERARALVPDATFVRADMATHDLGYGCFDAVVALYSLIHVPLAIQSSVIRKIASTLVDGGVLLAAVGWRSWTGQDPDWLGGGAPMWWSHADEATYRRWLQEAGFEIESVEFVPEADSGHSIFWAHRLPRTSHSRSHLP